MKCKDSLHYFHPLKVLAFQQIEANLLAKLQTGFLLALPLFLLGVLSTYGWKLETQSLQDTHNRLQQDQIKKTKELIQSDIFKLTDIAIKKVESILQKDHLASPRNLVLTSDMVSFLVFIQDKQRVYPPEESNQLMSIERSRLNMLSTALSIAQDKLNTSDSYQQLVFDTHEQRHSIFHCQHNTYSTGHSCVLLQPEILTSSLQDSLKRINASQQNWSFTLSTNDVSRNDNVIQLFRLSPPLQEFNISIKSHIESGFRISYWFGLLVIILPLSSSWFFLVWLLYYRQKADLQASKQRAELTAQLSHELRTPLANLSLYTDLLKRKAKEPESVKHYGNILEEEIIRLGKLAEQAIVVARGEPQHSHLGIASPDTIIQRLLDRFSSLWQQTGSQISFSGQADIELQFDQAALESILLQLLDNASKYASPGKIDINSWLDNGFLYLQVRDYSHGLPEHELKTIFHPETRGYQKQDTQGFGLGLAAARYFTHMNKGDLKVVNASPGLRFTASLSCMEAK